MPFLDATGAVEPKEAKCAAYHGPLIAMRVPRVDQLRKRRGHAWLLSKPQPWTAEDWNFPALSRYRAGNARKTARLTRAEIAGCLHHLQSFVARMESAQRRIDVMELILAMRVHGGDLGAVRDGDAQKGLARLP